jgi:hypothetical protein
MVYDLEADFSMQSTCSAPSDQLPQRVIPVDTGASSLGPPHPRRQVHVHRMESERRLLLAGPLDRLRHVLPGHEPDVVV